ncbi:MAG: response regulator transcription factor [Desulfobacteraceae bacterium]|nr:response regulator transcription factor [Desulfobacteraceae bacterium]
MKPLILIIDDDEKLNKLLTAFLADFGYEVISAVHPHKGLDKIKQQNPALVVLDVMLPDMNGFEVCRAIRSEYTVPVIMLTARGEVTDRIVGLELGADDYLAKPFEPRELVARIQSVLRRVSAIMDLPIQRFGELEIDYTKREARCNNLLVDLTTNEFNALLLLVKHPGKVLNRDQILQELRGMDCEAFNRSVDITMSRLRQKLGDDPKQPQYIKTVWGTGYVFIGERTDHADSLD